MKVCSKRRIFTSRFNKNIRVCLIKIYKLKPINNEYIVDRFIPKLKENELAYSA